MKNVIKTDKAPAAIGPYSPSGSMINISLFVFKITEHISLFAEKLLPEPEDPKISPL